MKASAMLCASVLAMAGFFSMPARADESTCLNTFYSMITKELDAANRQQGHPKPDFESMAKIKDIGLSRLEANASKWPKDATFSISVMDDYISLAVFCQGKMKDGEWRP
jgi:hypothetical protein